jgi:hypothetical protein
VLALAAEAFTISVVFCARLRDLRLLRQGLSLAAAKKDALARGRERRPLSGRLRFLPRPLRGHPRSE